MKSDRGAALGLLAAAALGLFLANSPLASMVFGIKDTVIGPASIGLNLSIEYWIKDLLLALFFMVAGLELKYELRLGILSRPSTALVPVFAALGGVVVPAAIYAAFNWRTEGLAGWPIPTATDIAFALGVLAIFGRGLPKAARIFLLALAIFDDLIAILLIAIFFTKDLQPMWLLIASIPLILLRATEGAAKLPHGLVRTLTFLATWYFILQSGVHPTIAGVLIGITIPAKRTHSLMNKLQPLTNSVILPLFAFSAVAIALPEFSSASNVFLGIAIALPIGKIVGISLVAWVANRLSTKEGRLELGFLDFVALGALAGVGFTVSLLMAALAFKGNELLIAEATMAVVVGSLISMAIGAVIATARGRHYMRQRKASN